MTPDLAALLDNLPSHFRSPPLYLEVSELLIQQGSWREAREVLRSGIREYPGVPELTLRLGELLLVHGELEETVEMLEHTAIAMESCMTAFKHLATVYKRQDRKDRAVLAYKVYMNFEYFIQDLTRTRPSEESPEQERGAPAGALVGPVEDLETETMAELYLKQGDLNRAEAIYLRLSEKDPDSRVYRRKLTEIGSIKNRKRKTTEQVLDKMTRILDGIQEP